MDTVFACAGGSDGFVSIWDGFNKKRLCQFKKYDNSVLSLCIAPDGSQIAIGTGDMFEAVDLANPANASKFDGAVYVRRIADQEMRPKSSTLNSQI